MDPYAHVILLLLARAHGPCQRAATPSGSRSGLYSCGAGSLAEGVPVSHGHYRPTHSAAPCALTGCGL